MKLADYITIEQKEINLIQKAFKAFDESCNNINILVYKNQLSLHSTNSIGATIDIKGLKVTGKDTISWAMSVSFSEFKKALDRTNYGPTNIKLGQDGASLKIKLGHLNASLSTSNYEKIGINEDIKITSLPISWFYNLKVALKPFEINTATQVILKEADVLVMDSIRRIICMHTKLENPLPKKIKTKNGKEFNLSLGIPNSQFNFLYNSILSSCSKLNEIEEISLYAVCVKDAIVGIKAELLDKDTTINIYCRLLDEDQYIKNLSIINNCTSFKSDFYFSVKALDLALSIGSTKILSLDNINLSNKDNNTLRVTSPNNDFSDELPIETNAKFTFGTFCGYLIKILSECAGPTEVKFYIHPQSSIICVDCSPNKYYIACLKTTEYPYSVGPNDIKQVESKSMNQIILDKKKEMNEVLVDQSNAEGK